MNAAFIVPFEPFTLLILTALALNIFVNGPKQCTGTACTKVSHARMIIVFLPEISECNFLFVTFCSCLLTFERRVRNFQCGIQFFR